MRAAARSAGTPVKRQDLAAGRKQAAKVLRRLDRLYPDARCTLDFRDPFELFVATVLSAQCTDERVNKTTPALFARYRDPTALARAPRSELEALIRPTGFFRNKAKNIQEAAQRIVTEFGGKMPATLEELITLPGTGRKTANVILGAAFNIPGITVDTHVRRLAQRLGWTRQQDPVKIEFELMKLLPKRSWTKACHQLIQHGRLVCKARKPLCERCALLQLCPSGPGNRPA